MEIRELVYFATACLFLLVTLWDAHTDRKKSA